MSTENQVEDVTEEFELAEKLRLEKEEEIRKDRERELLNKKEPEVKDANPEEIEEVYSPEELEDMRKQAEEFKATGNNYFNQSSFQESIDAYTKGIDILPEKPRGEDVAIRQLKSILYANRAACKDKLSESQPAIDDCTLSIKTDDKYLKAYFRRASIYERMKDYRNALADYKKMNEIDPHFQSKSVRDSISRLTPLAKKQEDEEREKMMSDLKDLGNKFLGLFGLSTDNFKAQQDPVTGSYSIQFDQNPSKT